MSLPDSEETRRNAAWFKAGADAFGSYSFAITVIIGAVSSLVAAIFHLETITAIAGVIGAQLVSLATVNLMLGIRSRTIARNESLQIDRF